MTSWRKMTPLLLNVVGRGAGLSGSVKWRGVGRNFVKIGLNLNLTGNLPKVPIFGTLEGQPSTWTF
jgi:hypothetical protein